MDYGINIYGSAGYGEEINLTPEQLTPDLMRYLPKLYKDSTVMQNEQGAFASDVGLLKWAIEDFLRQCYIDTATWGLDFWEDEAGIPIDNNKNYDNRRSVVKAKLRGFGTTTIDAIKSVAAAYSGGETAVIEHNSEYRFTVKFIGVKGVPPNLLDLKAAIDVIKPAHLGFDFAFSYMVWNEAATYTWNLAKPMTWAQFRVAFPYQP